MARQAPTSFISPGGIGGVLFAFPLYTVTWLWGKRRGPMAAAAGVVLNSAIWLLFGDGIQAMSRSKQRSTDQIAQKCQRSTAPNRDPSFNPPPEKSILFSILLEES
jgi:hypothetical protein